MVQGTGSKIIYHWKSDGQSSCLHLTKGPWSILKKTKEPKQFAHVVPYQCAKPVQMRFPVMMEFLFGKTVGFYAMIRLLLEHNGLYVLGS